MVNSSVETAVFGGGCFWCTEAVFQSLRGVESVMPGYAGGEKENPSYEEVSSGRSGHAEVIKIKYDPKQISFHDLLEVFFAAHDPTTPDKQGADVGEQYRSIIFYTSELQRGEAKKFIDELETAGTFDAPIVTQIKPLEKFFEAEDCHQNYYLNNPDKPYCQAVINPKLAKLRKKFAKLLKK